MTCYRNQIIMYCKKNALKHKSEIKYVIMLLSNVCFFSVCIPKSSLNINGYVTKVVSNVKVWLMIYVSNMSGNFNPNGVLNYVGIQREMI